MEMIEYTCVPSFTSFLYACAIIMLHMKGGRPPTKIIRFSFTSMRATISKFEE